MKIAVIGASGFVGNYILTELKKNKNLKIIATFKKNKIYGNDKKIIYKKLDIEKKKNFYKYLNRPEIIINASWQGLPNYDSNINYKSLRYQKILCKNLIENGLKNLVVLGTCFEYGRKNGKLDEKTLPKPITKYGNAKIKLLKYLQKLKKRHNYNLSWLRLFYMYGYNSKRDTLYNLIKKFEKNKILELSISGDLKRDYLDIRQISRFIKLIALKKRDIGVVNICSGRSISLKKLTRKLIKSKKKFYKIKFIKSTKNYYEANNFWGCKKKFSKVLNSLNF